jgi:hypothetical protein
MLSGSQKVVTRPLPDDASFLIPTVGTDGAASDFVSGPGVQAAGGTTYVRDVIIAANGSVPNGDFNIYLGVNSNRPADQRALTVRGATMRTTFWSYNSGAWLVRDY